MSGVPLDTPGPSAAILNAVRSRAPVPWLIAIAGIPGAGKSTVAARVRDELPGAAVVSMDGYHLPRRLLDAEGLLRRGAPDTFDAPAFRADLAQLRATRHGVFPVFDHAAQDPEPGAVVITPDVPLVVVEGLYLLLRSWQMADLFDLRVFLVCHLETALARVAARHLACGLAASADEARRRADSNDRRNALTILADGCPERADILIATDAPSPLLSPFSHGGAERPQ